jgi:hypothetical protein
MTAHDRAAVLAVARLERARLRGASWVDVGRLEREVLAALDEAGLSREAERDLLALGRSVGRFIGRDRRAAA